MKMLIAAFGFLGFLNFAEASNAKFVLMISAESAQKIGDKGVDSYCSSLSAPCEFQTSGTCTDQAFKGWRVPAKEDLDHFSDRTKSAHFVWTSSTLFAAGDMYPAIYRLSKGGAYTAAQGRKYHARCVKWERVG